MTAKVVVVVAGKMRAKDQWEVMPLAGAVSELPRMSKVKGRLGVAIAVVGIDRRHSNQKVIFLILIS